MLAAGKPKGLQRQQEDAQEFLNWVLDNAHQELLQLREIYDVQQGASARSCIMHMLSYAAALVLLRVRVPVQRPGHWLQRSMFCSTLRDEQSACCCAGDWCWTCKPQVGQRTPACFGSCLATVRGLGLCRSYTPARESQLHPDVAFCWVRLAGS